jgi:hypothetical protein
MRATVEVDLNGDPGLGDPGGQSCWPDSPTIGQRRWQAAAFARHRSGGGWYEERATVREAGR